MVAGNNVAGRRRGAADGDTVGKVDEDAVEVGQGSGAGGVGADIVALDQAAGAGPIEVDAHDVAAAVAGNDVPGAGARAADGGICRAIIDFDLSGRIAEGGGAGHVGADVVALQDVARRTGAGNLNAIAGEAVEDQPLDSAAAAGEGQAVHARSRAVAAQLDDGIAAVARLRRGVEDDTVADGRQGRGRCDAPVAAAAAVVARVAGGDVEENIASARDAVGVLNGAAQGDLGHAIDGVAGVRRVAGLAAVAGRIDDNRCPLQRQDPAAVLGAEQGVAVDDDIVDRGIAAGECAGTDNLEVLRQVGQEAVAQRQVERAGQRRGAADDQLSERRRVGVGAGHLNVEVRRAVLSVVAGDAHDAGRIAGRQRAFVEDVAGDIAVEDDRGAVGDFQGVAAVEQWTAAVGRGADDIVVELIVDRGRPIGVNAVAVVPGDHVGRRGGGAADGIVAGPAIEYDAGEAEVAVADG